jgi:serine/threonine-protein kinase
LRLQSQVVEPEDGTLIGEEVGGYVVESELGRGGMGVVYAATHPMIGKRAAIKVLKSSLSSNPATVERFIQEARSVNQIGHPNIVDIFAFGRLTDGRNYLVMDLLEGESLRKRVKRSAVPPAEAIPLLDEIASALIAAHDKGFIHRDLKPDNVFLVANPNRFEVKLLDFGLAKLSKDANLTSERAFRTATGAQIGTPDYMSPEQLRGSGVDHRTDIYALGIMAFEILVRMRPHRFADGSFDLDGRTFKDVLQAVPGVPPELADLIEAMIARDPEERPSLVAMRNVLKRARTAVDAAPNEPPPPAAFDPMLSVKPTVVRQAVVPPGSSTVASEARPAIAPPIPPSSPALRASGAAMPGTKLGVPPPPARNSRPHPLTAARPAGESKIWLAIGALLVVGCTIVLVLVLLR